MCDCYNSSDYSSDDDRNLIGDSESKLVPLNFANYEKCGFHEILLDAGVYLTDFDKDKVSIKRNDFNDNNFDILYDGKPFRVYIRAFTGITKRSKYLSREKMLRLRIQW